MLSPDQLDILDELILEEPRRTDASVAFTFFRMTRIPFSYMDVWRRRQELSCLDEPDPTPEEIAECRGRYRDEHARKRLSGPPATRDVLGVLPE